MKKNKQIVAKEEKIERKNNINAIMRNIYPNLKYLSLLLGHDISLNIFKKKNKTKKYTYLLYITNNYI